MAVGCGCVTGTRSARVDRRVDHFDAGARLRQRRGGEPAVAHDGAGAYAPGEPIEPMTACGHVHPQDEGDRMPLRDRAEERERPRLMAHHDVGAIRSEQRGKRAPRAPHGQRARDARIAKYGDRHTGISKVGGDAPLRRQRHRHVHRRRERSESRERQQEGLHPAVQISAMNVQNAHSNHCFHDLRRRPASGSSPGAGLRSTAASCPCRTHRAARYRTTSRARRGRRTRDCRRETHRSCRYRAAAASPATRQTNVPAPGSTSKLSFLNPLYSVTRREPSSSFDVDADVHVLRAAPSLRRTTTMSNGSYGRTARVSAPSLPRSAMLVERISPLPTRSWRSRRSPTSAGVLPRRILRNRLRHVAVEGEPPGIAARRPSNTGCRSPPCCGSRAAPCGRPIATSRILPRHFRWNSDVAHGEHFVDDQDLAAQVRRDGKGQPHVHAAAVVLHRAYRESARRRRTRRWRRTGGESRRESSRESRR